ESRHPQLIADRRRCPWPTKVLRLFTSARRDGDAPHPEALERGRPNAGSPDERRDTDFSRCSTAWGALRNSLVKGVCQIADDDRGGWETRPAGRHARREPKKERRWVIAGATCWFASLRCSGDLQIPAATVRRRMPAASLPDQ